MADENLEHKLTIPEKKLRDYLLAGPNGPEWWMIVKAGFRGSYEIGKSDADENLLTLARQRILEWRDEGGESNRERDFEQGVLALLVDVLEEDWETVRNMIFANHSEFLTDSDESTQPSTDDRSATVIFSEDTSSNWKIEPEYNQMFLRQVSNYLNQKLKAQGFICLNDILLELGLNIDKDGYSKVWSAEDGDSIEFEHDLLASNAIKITIGALEKKRLTQTNAPVGLVALLGRPGNERFIVKAPYGKWRSVSTGELVNDEDFRAGWMPYFVDIETFEPVES